MSAIFEKDGVKVSKDVVNMVRAMVRGAKFYRQEEAEKQDMLRALGDVLCIKYEVEEISKPKLFFGTPGNITSMNEETKEINVELMNTSIISFLHEFRHVLQFTEKVELFEGMDKEEDAYAWSLRVFAIASPKNFENSVKSGRIAGLRWSEEENKAVDINPDLYKNRMFTPEELHRMFMGLDRQEGDE